MRKADIVVPDTVREWSEPDPSKPFFVDCLTSLLQTVHRGSTIRHRDPFQKRTSHQEASAVKKNQPPGRIRPSDAHKVP